MVAGFDNVPAAAWASYDLTTFVQKNAQLRQLEQDYDITGKLEEQAAKLPARLGDAAGVLSDIGVGIINSLFATITLRARK